MSELTPSGIAALFGLDERRVREAVEHGVFALAGGVYLFAVAAFGVELRGDDRKTPYRLIAAALAERTPPKSIELGLRSADCSKGGSHVSW